MPKAVATDTPDAPAPETYCLGHHPRRTDHPALLDAAGHAVATFALDATRAEITASLASGGFTLHADGTVTKTPAQPVASRRGVITGLAAGIAGVAVIASQPVQAAYADPDEVLIAACNRFLWLDAQQKTGDSLVWLHSTPPDSFLSGRFGHQPQSVRLVGFAGRAHRS